MDWEAVKDHAKGSLRWLGKFLLFQNLMLYLFACMIAGDVLGLKAYIGFLYHCCQWKGQ